MDRNLYRPRILLLALTLLLTAGFLCCPGTPAPLQHGDSGEIQGIAAFREARMGLPESSEVSCLVAAGDLPVWDSRRNVFAAGGQRVQESLRCPQEYRLILSREMDLDGDGMPEEYILRDGKVTVRSDTRIVWQSPDDWWVDYFFLGDATNDGNIELNLLVWKEGSFGRHKPFWLEEDDPAVKNHLFIFKLAEGAFKPVWQSSNLDRPNYLAALIDLNGDGENELVVAEGSYDDPEKRKITLWKWNGWGFSRIDPEEN